MRIKACSRCKADKPLKEFNKGKRWRDGFCKWCKACEQKRKRDWKLTSPSEKKEYAAKYRALFNDKNRIERFSPKDRTLARNSVTRALESGRLKRLLTCENCGEPKPTQAHHEDYSKKLDVIWLCRSCHKIRHTQLNLISKEVRR